MPDRQTADTQGMPPDTPTMRPARPHLTPATCGADRPTAPTSRAGRPPRGRAGAAWPARAGLALLLALSACGGGGASTNGAAGSTATLAAVGTDTAAAMAAAASAAAATAGSGSADLLLADAGNGLTVTGSTSTAGTSAEPVATVTTTPATDSPPTASTMLGPNELAVLVAEGDPLSEAIARAYVAARGVPEGNIVRLPIAPGSDSISATDFASLKAQLDSRLPAHTQALLVTWNQPSRVTGACAMGITSALALGYDTRWCGGCNRTQASPLYDSASRRPWTDHRVRPAMMLGATTLEQAQALINRGVAADGLMRRTGASGTGVLLRTSDAARSVRWPDFLLAAATPVAGVSLRYQDNQGGTGSNVASNLDGLMFYFTGLAQVPLAASNHWLPGAAADSLTSFAGLLPGANGQMPATAWLSAGATASFGTVEEPCNYTQKFPQASVLIGHYQRGETLIEAYWKSVQWPGQGLFVGEPLARPWAAL